MASSRVRLWMDDLPVSVASVRFGRDSSPRFDITVVDILVAAAIYTLLFSIPGEVTI
jgi:hypothetical protein